MRVHPASPPAFPDDEISGLHMMVCAQVAVAEHEIECRSCRDVLMCLFERLGLDFVVLLRAWDNAFPVSYTPSRGSA